MSDYRYCHECLLRFDLVEQYNARSDILQCDRCSLPYQATDQADNSTVCRILNKYEDWKHLRDRPRLKVVAGDEA
jgi:hypothetical protein